MEFIKMIDTNNEIMYFDTFNELCNYFDKVAIDFDDLIEQLEEEAAGMAIPKISFCNKFKIEFNEKDIWHNVVCGHYCDTFEEAKSDFKHLIKRAKDSENEMDMFEGIYLYEYDFNNCGDFDNKKMIYGAEKKNNYSIMRCKDEKRR